MRIMQFNRVVCLTILGTIFGCHGEIRKGEKPISQFEFYSDYVSVELEDKYTVSGLLKIDLFQGLKLGTTPRKIQEILKLKGRYHKVNEQTHYLEFRAEHGLLRAYEEYSIEDGILNWLEIVPIEKDLRKLFIPQLIDVLDFSKPELNKIYTQTSNGKEFLTVTLKNSELESIAWLSAK